MRCRAPLRRVGRFRPGVALESGSQSTASRSSVHGPQGALDADTDRSLCAAVICPLRNLLAAFRYHREGLPDPTPVHTNGIIEQTLRRGRQAYAQLIARYQDSVFAFLWRIGLRRSVIEELAQKTFVRAWTHLGNFQPARSAFSTWLFAIGRNLALNEIGRAGHRLEVAADDDAEPASCEDNPPAAARAQALPGAASRRAGSSRLGAAQRAGALRPQRTEPGRSRGHRRHQHRRRQGTAAPGASSTARCVGEPAMNEELDELLRAADGCAPHGFDARVLRHIAAMPPPRRRALWCTLA